MKTRKANEYLDFFRKLVKNEVFNYEEMGRILNYFYKEKSSVDVSYIGSEWESFLKNASRELKENIQLYVHIPFCMQRCTYCENPSDKLSKSSELDSYITNSLKEISYFLNFFKGLKFSRFSVGGGTPNILKEEQLNKLFSKIFNNFEFQKESIKEIEFNPLFTSSAKLKLSKEFGFNRLSFGVQSLNKEVLASANRSYSNFELIKKSVFLAQEAGFWDISVDLIFGFQEESYEQFEKNLLKICSLNPYRIEIYFLRPPNVNYLKKYFNGSQEEFYQRIKVFRKNFLQDRFRKKVEKYEYILVPDQGNDCLGLIKNTPSYYWFQNRKDNFTASCFGIGKYASSSVFGKSSSVRKMDFSESKSTYNHISTGLQYEMLRYVLFHGERVPITPFKSIFKKDIFNVFELPFNLLKELKRIKVVGDDILFSIKEPEDMFIYSLFFLITKNGRIFKQFVDDYNAEKYFTQ